MANNQSAVEVRGISKSYANHQAVRNLSFEVRPGEIFGLLGPNGAGKTSTIRMILDIIRPDGGEISVLGGRMQESTKDRIGYLPEERGLYEDMTVEEVLVYLGRLKGLSPHDARRQLKKYLEEVDLWEVRTRKISALSRGMNQKAQFVAATMHEPDLIVVDEPFSGLDPVNAQIIKALIYRMQARGAAIIMSTHQMNRVEEMCGRILLIDQGKEVLYGNLAEIRQRFAGHAVEVDLAGRIERVPGVTQLAARNGGYRLTLADGISPEEVLRTLVGMPDVSVRRFEQVELSLEEIFVQVVGREMEPEEQAA